ncbi:hypothetical protein EDB92DRAFT_2090696, partial [Lactarius akahatsu]
FFFFFFFSFSRAICPSVRLLFVVALYPSVTSLRFCLSCLAVYPCVCFAFVVVIVNVRRLSVPKRTAREFT